MSKLRTLFFLILWIPFSLLNAQSLKINPVFSDHMVLQREVPVPVWGQADPGHEIEVTLGSHTRSVKTAKDGTWTLQLPAQKAGGNHVLIVKDAETGEQFAFANVTFGDIWLCGGQSNMEWDVQRTLNAEQEIRTAKYPSIRLLNVPSVMANAPQKEIDGLKWEICSPATVPDFSAVGYYFGRSLHDSLDVPIGLISNNWGGTVAETWISPESLQDLPVYAAQIEKLAQLDIEKETAGNSEKYQKWLEGFAKNDPGMQNGEYFWQNLEDYSAWQTADVPGNWETYGDPALANFDGAVWYQRDFVLTEEQAGTISGIHMGRIDDSDQFWINGQLVGESRNAYNKERNYEIPAGVLQEGSNSLVVRIEDYTGEGGFLGNAEQYYFSMGDEQIPFAGSWRYKIGYTPETPSPRRGFGPNAYPSMLYFSMIAPITPFPIKGVIWYQGESNAGRAVEYEDIFRRLILDWRKQFNIADLPFLFVQLANFKSPPESPSASQWAELREAQASVLDLPNTGMITAIDIGEANDIHPRNKQEVGRRLSMEALRIVYGRSETHAQGPVFQSVEFKEDHAIIWFNTHGRKLVNEAAPGFIRGFTISGEDQQFYWAKGEIVEDNKVKVWSENVQNPVAVRYAWADNPQPADLSDDKDLPAFPFRTDDWTLSTEGKTRD